MNKLHESTFLFVTYFPFFYRSKLTRFSETIGSKLFHGTEIGTELLSLLRVPKSVDHPDTHTVETEEHTETNVMAEENIMMSTASVIHLPVFTIYNSKLTERWLLEIIKMHISMLYLLKLYLSLSKVQFYIHFSSQQHNMPQVHFNKLNPIFSLVQRFFLKSRLKKIYFHHVLLHLDAN